MTYDIGYGMCDQDLWGQQLMENIVFHELKHWKEYIIRGVFHMGIETVQLQTSHSDVKLNKIERKDNYFENSYIMTDQSYCKKNHSIIWKYRLRKRF